MNELLQTYARLLPERTPVLAQLLTDSFWELLPPIIELTIPIAAASFVLGLAIALAAAIVRFKAVPVLSKAASVYVWLVRGTPLLVQLFVVFFGLPSLDILIDPVPAAIAVFSLNVGAYASEILRGALEGVPRGQWAAGRSLGLTEAQILRVIVLPQAMRSATPALMNTLVSLVKDTSLASSITVTEMFMTAQQIAARTYEPFWLYAEAAVLYLAICTVLTGVQMMLEQRLRVPGR